MVRVIDHRSTGSHTEPLGCMSLRPEREAAPTARRWFSRFTTSLRDTRQDDCLLLLSELVTNALTYGGRGDLEWHIYVEWWREGRTLHVAVHSPGDPEPLRVRHAGENDETGRGLFLVDCLADSWRAAPSHFGGIRVSFALEGALAAP